MAEFSGLISATKVVIIAACNSGAGVINEGAEKYPSGKKKVTLAGTVGGETFEFRS